MKKKTKTKITVAISIFFEFKFVTFNLNKAFTRAGEIVLSRVLFFEVKENLIIQQRWKANVINVYKELLNKMPIYYVLWHDK